MHGTLAAPRRSSLKLSLVAGASLVVGTLAGCSKDDKPSLCEDFCHSANGWSCPNQSLSACVAGCNESISTPPCGDEWEAFLKCTTGGGFICLGDGTAWPMASGCTAHYDALAACAGPLPGPRPGSA